MLRLILFQLSLSSFSKVLFFFFSLNLLSSLQLQTRYFFLPTLSINYFSIKPYPPFLSAYFVPMTTYYLKRGLLLSTSSHTAYNFILYFIIPDIYTSCSNNSPTCTLLLYFSPLFLNYFLL